MRKLLVLLLILTLTIIPFTGCAGSTAKEDTNTIKIVSTIFPPYDFSKEITKGKAEISLLIPPGTESHSYEPTPQDIIEIENCDLFIYVGGISDSWVSKILNSIDKKVKTLALMDCVDAVEEKIIEGMEEEKEDKPSENGKEYDEHVWTSPKNAIKIVKEIASAISETDADNAQTYQKNADNYIEKLTSLDNDFKDFFESVENKTLIFGDRFPFRYFADEYGISYYAAFPGCSHESEASAGTIAFLIDKVKKEKVSTIFYIEFSKHKIADSIAEATGAKIALLHSCHNVSPEDLKNNISYLSLMEQNLKTLKTALK